MIESVSLTAKLPVFPPAAGLPGATETTRRVLGSRVVRSVNSYALGPDGTNIIRAATQWHVEMSIAHKATVIPCSTVEESIMLTRANNSNGCLSIFWTCAVYFRENQVFFENPDLLPFTFWQILPLDEMQLACPPALAAEFESATVCAGWRILTHLSPAPLVKSLGCEVIEARSNADAAVRCAAGEAEACVTTEAARLRYGLSKLHGFGSPDMFFFGGVAPHGLALLRQAHEGTFVSTNQAQIRLPLNPVAA
jgi:hypothetical protein